MFFSRFLKHTKCSHKYERLLFFLSSHIYFRRNALASYYKHFTKNWTDEDPHPSNELYRRFLAIDAGHYGLYYTVYNHDADQSAAWSPQVTHETLYEYLLRASHNTRLYYDKGLLSGAEFMILEANRDISTTVIGIKATSHVFIDTVKTLATRQKLPFHSQATRAFHSSAKSSNVEKTSSPPKAADVTRVVGKVADDHNTTTTEVPFETSFLATQSRLILEAFKSHTPDALNAVYPLYQSLKRNNITFPNIDMYNVVLSSISKRSLDSGPSLDELESKLTTLLLVYQDILHLKMKPNHETFDTVLHNLFLASLISRNVDSTSPYTFEAAQTKLLEFAQIGVDILKSISDILQLDLAVILPDLLQIFEAHPETISPDLITKLSSYWLVPGQDYSEQYYMHLIAFTRHFTRLNIFSDDPSKLEEFISSVYNSYCDANIPNKNEFVIYAQMIHTFVSNSQTLAALAFLDKILCDYKNSLDKPNKPSKTQILTVLSAYVLAIARSGHETAVIKAYELLRKFNSISYLPELDPLVYNQLIQGFYNAYCLQRNNISNGHRPVIEDPYNRARKLYEHVAIRRDFQETSWSSMARTSDKSTVHCRDLMLLMSLDMGDHEFTFLVIKEILAKGHAVGDMIALTSLLQYLRNASHALEESSAISAHYFNCLWNVAESQSVHYTSSPDLNRYLSEIVCYLMVPQSNDLIFKLLNSSMIRSAIDMFNLSSDPIYGLVLVSHYISNYTGTDVLIRNKILNFNAKLICQFQDEDNHYIVYEDDVQAFKSALLSQFKDTLTLAPLSSLHVSSHIVRAAKLCGIEDMREFHQVAQPWGNANFEKDLTILLNTNLQVGVSKFIECFKQGYHFNAGTWEIIINFDFVKAVLDPTQSGLRPLQFIERLWQQQFDVAIKTDLTMALINCQSDHVNIKVVEFLRNTGLKIEDPYKTCLVNGILGFSAQSPNIKLQSELSNGFFAKVFDESSHGDIERYFEYLAHKSEFAELVEIFQHQPNLILGNQTLHSYYLQAIDAQSSLNERVIRATEQISLDLVTSPRLARFLLTHCVKMNETTQVAKARATVLRLDGKSQASREAVAYADAVMLVRGHSIEIDVRKTYSHKELNRLLLTCDIKGMVHLLTLNKQTLLNSFDDDLFLQDIIADMLSIAAICEGSESALLRKFENIMDLFERAGIRMRPSHELPRLVAFLTAVRASDMLDILTRKLSNNEVGITIKLFLTEFPIATTTEKHRILQSIRSAFVGLGYSLGIHRIDKLCS